MIHPVCVYFSTYFTLFSRAVSIGYVHEDVVSDEVILHYNIQSLIVVYSELSSQAKCLICLIRSLLILYKINTITLQMLFSLLLSIKYVSHSNTTLLSPPPSIHPLHQSSSPSSLKIIPPPPPINQHPPPIKKHALTPQKPLLHLPIHTRWRILRLAFKPTYCLFLHITVSKIYPILHRQYYIKAKGHRI